MQKTTTCSNLRVTNLHPPRSDTVDGSLFFISWLSASPCSMGFKAAQFISILLLSRVNHWNALPACLLGFACMHVVNACITIQLDYPKWVFVLEFQSNWPCWLSQHGWKQYFHFLSSHPKLPIWVVPIVCFPRMEKLTSTVRQGWKWKCLYLFLYSE